MARLFTASATPHLRDRTNIPTIMYSVIAALMPAMAGAVYFFGVRALFLTALAIVTCVITEGLIEKLSGKPLTIWDGSAILTGLLLAFNLPGGTAWWIPVIGGVFAIAVAKMTFGGLGYNPLNPALASRVFLLVSFPLQMSATWTAPRGTIVDAVSVATPLSILKQNMATLKSQVEGSIDIQAVNAAMSNISDLKASYMDMFIGRISGCIGETSALLLLIGAVYLMYKHFIGWRIPFSFVGTVALLSWIFGGYEGYFTGMWLFHILTGGVILGAFYMATDMVTSPITPNGRILFGVGCGALTVLIRLIGGYPEGVSFAIILMNLTVPLIDRYTRPRVFGAAKKRA